MKIEMFHLCPYRDLPEDFREKNRSVWVDVPSHLFDAEIAGRTYNETLDELKYAAEMGYDGICVNEHHQNAYGLMPSPNLMAAPDPLAAMISERTLGGWVRASSSAMRPPMEWPMTWAGSASR